MFCRNRHTKHTPCLSYCAHGHACPGGAKPSTDALTTQLRLRVVYAWRAADYFVYESAARCIFVGPRPSIYPHLLPLDRCGWLSRDVVYDARDSRYFVDDSMRDPVQKFVR